MRFGNDSRFRFPTRACTRKMRWHFSRQPPLCGLAPAESVSEAMAAHCFRSTGVPLRVVRLVRESGVAGDADDAAPSRAWPRRNWRVDPALRRLQAGSARHRATSPYGASQRIMPVLQEDIFQAREAVGKLPRDLTLEERLVLWAFIEQINIPSDEREKANLHVLKNDIMTALLNQRKPPAEFTPKMLAIHRNRSQDPVIRDYALQHLILHRRSRADPAEREAIAAALWEALAETSQALSGTALLELYRMRNDLEPDDLRRLGTAAVGMAEAGQSPPPARLTATRILEKWNPPEKDLAP